MKKLDSILSKIYIISGAFVVICFGAYFIKLLISPEGTLPWIAVISVNSAVILPFIFRKTLKKHLKNSYIIIKLFICAAMVFYTVTFIILVGYIYLPSDRHQPSSEGDGAVYIVFGAKINSESGYPTATLISRLDAAYDALISNPNSICIVSGGQGKDEPITEALSMKRYLVSRGIEAKKIFEEDQARNTAENIRYSQALLEGTEYQDRQIVCVSSDTHIPRIRLLCKNEGIDSEYLPAESPKKEYLFTTWVREYLSYARMLLVGY